MSRSKRKAPIFPPARVSSESKDKKAWHARYRALLKKRLDDGLNGEIDEVDAWCLVDEVSNHWHMRKDGKIWLSQLVEGDQ
jgi:hypothetical protein